MRTFHFGSPSGRFLFGVFHPPQTTPPRSTAVLLCNPFGEEAIRAHRIYKVLATQLARLGHAVLRFDYLGTGDSAGDETSLDDLLDSISMAAGELRGTSGVSRVAAIGLRLGATLAALAAMRGSVLDDLLLWDPIVDGRAYLRELSSAHAEYMTEEMGRDVAPPRSSADGHPVEALGHPLSPSFASSLAAISLGAADRHFARRVVVVSTTSSPELKQLEARIAGWAERTEWIATTTSVPWNSDAAVNSAVVPMDVLKTLMAHVEEKAA